MKQYRDILKNALEAQGFEHKAKTSEEERAVEEQRRIVEMQRQQWITHPYTEHIVKELHNKVEELRERASDLASVSYNPEQLVKCQLLLTESKTLKKAITYAITGRYEE